MRVWFPDFYTEAHRVPERQSELVKEFAKLGIRCSKRNYDCSVAFCGTTWQSEQMAACSIPVVHYCWDLYPWQVEGTAPECWKPHLWGQYIEQLRTCAAVVVPSACTATRVQEYAGRESTTVRAPVKLWGAEVDFGGYVVDVMRKYPDPNKHAVKRVCERYGYPYVETGAALSRSEFERTIAGASLLVSAYYEASTGGLTLLEGYALGKPVLLSNSPYHGGVDYFGDRAAYFQWDDEDSLAAALSPRRVPADCKEWVESTFSDAKFAEGVAEVLRSVQLR